MSPVSPPPPFTLDARSGRRRTLISLTPLIDVVFILLIFFMLASSFLDWRAIELNASRKTTGGSSMEGAMLVEVRANGIRLAGRTVTPEQLQVSMRQRLEDDPDLRVLVKPSAGVDLQRTIRVVDRLSAAGAADMTLIRDPDTGSGSRR